MADPRSSRFVGESTFVRLWPIVMVVAGALLASRGGFAVGLAFALLGAAFASLLPWRFFVFDEGLFLQFAFGKRRFLARDEVTVRVGRSGSVVHQPGRAFGYPLPDRLVERRSGVLRAVLAEHGYRVA